MVGIRLANMILNLPFSALRAFEAVVRQGGFSAAADELGVSQSAISQHVKALEEWLGQDLLVRGARGSSPTREGEELAQAIAAGLGRISDVCARLRDRTRADKTIVISCLPGFAFTWLFPRLLRFDLAHPDLSISVATDTGQVPFSAVDADIGIRYGLGHHPDAEVDLLLNERLFPVCAPALLSRPHPLRRIEDLAHYTLLENETLTFGDKNPTWSYWAAKVGVSLPAGARSRRFGQANMVTQAAIEGVGVALGREPLVIDALCDGRLVRPFPQITDSPLSYWLVRRKGGDDSPKIREFLAWIKSEAETQPEIPGPVS